MDARNLGKLMRGVALVADALADAVEGAAPSAAADEFLFGSPPAEAGAVQTPAMGPDFLASLLRGALARAQGHTVAADAPEPLESGDPFDAAVRQASEAAAAAPAVDDSVIPAVENGVALLPCLEIDYQRREQRRRRVLRADPVQAMTVASYWLAHLAEQPLRAEEWTRCVECVPGTASSRFNAAMNLGLSELRAYATYYDECLRALQGGKDKAAQMAKHAESIGPDEAIDPNDLLDADRIGRILFWLGDRPDVEALTSVPPATADVLDADREADQLLTLEELEHLDTLDATVVEIDVPEEPEPVLRALDD